MKITEHILTENPCYKAGKVTREASLLTMGIRTGPGTDYPKTGKYTGAGSFTIVEEYTLTVGEIRFLPLRQVRQSEH